MLQKQAEGGLQNVTYAIQWLAFTLSSIIIIPILVGVSMELNPAETAAFLQRTFFFVGLFSFIQAKWGHGTPLVEGPGGMWYSLFIIVAVLYPQMGKSLVQLRSDLVAGLLLSGVMYLVLVLTGLYSKIRPLFTPMVNGTFLILMPFSLSGTVIRGVLGREAFSLPGLAAALVAVAVVLLVSLKGRGFFQSISVLCGLAAGWVAAYLLGVRGLSFSPTRFLAFPEFLAWGRPSLDYGILISSFITGILILANHVAATYNAFPMRGKEAQEKDYNRGLVVTGLANISAGLWGTIGFIPFASTIGFIKLTGMVWKKPFILFSAFLIFISLFPAIGGFFVSMPEQVGYAVLLVVLGQIIAMGFREYARLAMDNRDALTCGLSLMVGVGVMFLPVDFLSFLDPTLRIVLGNGLIMGLLTCILLERILK